MSCELCEQDGGLVVHRDRDWRVVRVEDAAFPAFYRVICNHHVAEFSELLAPERQRCMNLVTLIERTLLGLLRPTKINLASLGNVVPHVHWHIVARFDWDSHFPQPLWGVAQRQLDEPALERLALSLPELDRAVANAVRAC